MLKRFEEKIINKIKQKDAEDVQEGKGNISSLSSSDTTLFRKDVRPKLKSTKRKIILDRDITPSIFEKLKKKCVQNSFNLSQKSIIEILYPLGISNITIAKVVNDLIPNAKATQGSIASMIRFLKNYTSSKQMANELDRLLNDI